jgi:hypothetical protein
MSISCIHAIYPSAVDYCYPSAMLDPLKFLSFHRHICTLNGANVFLGTGMRLCVSVRAEIPLQGSMVPLTQCR